MCFLLIGHKFKSRGYVYHHRHPWAEGGPLSHKQGDLIHQFGCWLGIDLKNRLLLLLLLLLLYIYIY
jgi:hypothetical protein